MENNKLITNFEREILFQIVFRLRQGRISSKKAQEIAIQVLKVIKNKPNEHDFSKKMAKVCEYYPEVMEAYIATFAEHEKDVKSENIKNVLESLKNEMAEGGE